MDLRGKTVVVTGGTSGIGRATALALARRGAEVVAIGRDAGKGATLERELRVASGGAGSFAQADLSLVAEAQRVVAAILARFDRVDALILSAGMIELEPAVTAEGLDRSYVTNFLHKLVVAEGLKSALTRGTGGSSSSRRRSPGSSASTGATSKVRARTVACGRPDGFTSRASR